MGLYQDRFRFEAALPDLEAARLEVERRLGRAGSVEALYSDGQTVVCRTMLDPFTRTVACAVMQELGGQFVDFEGRPAALRVPAWAHGTIREMPWRERMAVRHRWWAWFFGTGRPRST